MFQKESFRKNIKTNHDTADDNIRDVKLKYNINREVAKNQHYHLENLTNMNILQTKKY